MPRFSPLITDSFTLKNRLVVPPMASQTADLDGLAMLETLTHSANLAKSGASLVMVEYSFVSLAGRSEANQLGAHDDRCIAGLAEIANIIHQAGAKAALQLTHCGGKDSSGTSVDLMGPAGITVPAYDRELPLPRAMTMDDIADWQQDFVHAALRAEQAGFDFVELHCAHGYGLNQFLSPITNQRTDKHGGTLINQARLITDIITDIIQQAPKLKLMVRIPGQDLYPGGLSQTDMVDAAQLMVTAGVDILNISSGIGGWTRPKNRRGQGYLINESQYMKQANLGVPIIGVGGIEEGDYIDTAIENDWLDLAAVGRSILKDPADFYACQMIKING